MTTAFTRRGAAPEQVRTAEVDKLHSKIGQLVAERDFWADASQQLLGARGKNGEHGKGAWRETRMIERLWRSLKYERVYLNALETGSEIQAKIRKWLISYNSDRPHATHGYYP